MAGHEAEAELAQHQGVESWIGEVEAEEVLSVDAATSRLGCAAIHAVLGESQHGDERQPPGPLRLGGHERTTTP
ncbi:hypothetical protein [Methylobacterium sp. SyP6R]|uniref:hypothetical protein n=1 Tax=Methylobacterium sp. SyP6R TaxID=2718876 RepID=UPI001F38D149|nr:hypothetical protein [Methylobacterium sp. SyP6R]MCF4130151.1 hypothetical protein [Methylobacterium sp. SyP6R]